MKKHAKKLVVLLLAVAMIIPTIATLYSSAADATYPVELGFNNLFIFEEWASNENSTSVVFGGTKDVGTLTTDIPNGSFRLTKTSTDVPQVYNGHGEDKTNSINNTDYYSIAVEPNATYTFSYNASGNVFSTTDSGVTPYLFMFDSDFLCKVIYEAPGAASGANSFTFITPSDVAHIQFRFTLTSGATPYADISNISVTECDVTLDSTTNLFNLSSWKNSSNYAVSAFYGAGTVNATDEVITLTTDPTKGDSLFTAFDLESNAGYYNIPVEANTSYVLKYNLINSTNSAFLDFSPYIVRSTSSGAVNYDYVSGVGASGYGANSAMFTTKGDTAYISVVFTINHGITAWGCQIKNIELWKVTELDDNKISPNRLVKTYGTDATYGTLPTPTAPANHIFAGWNTKEDGTGMRITADTPVQPLSYTVYPKFEPAVDTLTVKTQPSKTVYTKGEKLDTTGLVLQATITSDGITNTFDIPSGYYCTPEVLNTTGTQTITAHYGGKTATFTVTVKDSDPGIVVINGVSTDVAIANGEYTFNYSTSAFNRYEVTYKSDSYVSGVATFNDGKTEEFFLEPSDNGSFGSFVNDLFKNNTYNQVVKIKFTTLNKENGKFELVSLKTVNVPVPDATIYFDNAKYQMGVSLEYGGVVSELYDLSDDVYARTYANGSNDITLVDYKNKLDGGYIAESQKVNLINTLDRGRYLQQSYYGTDEKPYIQSEYNNAAWPYNPVQGGNVIGEASKIIDYKVTNDYVYVKARPLDWAKWSDEYAATDSRYEAIWGDDYVTDTYVESWYYFQDGTIKVTNRKVDYSGLPDASHSQEFPALYLIEPLNHFVYNNVSAQDAWKSEANELYNNYQFIDYTDATRGTHWSKTHNSGYLINYEEPEYWGLTQMYKDKFGMQDFQPWVTVNENWAAFTASEDQDSFGVGLYTDTTTKFYYGVQPTMYQQKAGDTEGSVGEVLDTPEYRHAQTVNPSPELPTSYIAPTDTAIFRSYEPTEFTYYLTTGTASEIREEFRNISKAEDERAKPKIAVPETVYVNPANNKDGQYYANNVLNPNNYYSIETKTEYTDMYLGVYADNGHTHISVNVDNVTNPDENVDVRASDGSASYDGIVFQFTEDTDPNPGTFIFPAGLDMDFVSGGLEPGEKATVKWTITTYAADPAINPNCEKETFVAYTVMYAPHRTVGAVAEARQVAASMHEVSSWITGANGIDHSTRTPLGTFHGDYRNSGYFREDPLVHTNPPTGGSGQTAYDYILGYGTQNGSNDDYQDDCYVMQTATNDHDSSRSQSYLGLLAIDKSRYTNTDQIPNLSIGYDALRVSDYKKDSLGKYNTYYTVGDELAYTASSLSAAPSGWTSYSSHTDIADKLGVPYRERFVPSYKIADLDGKYIHAIAQGTANQTINPNQYSTAGTSVLIDITDKSALRDAVTDGYSVKDPSEEFLENLKEAATILGDPGASQEDIDRVTDTIKEYVNIFYALKYDNLFSAYEMSQHPESMKVVSNKGTATYEDGTITVVNDTITGGEAYTVYGSADHFYKVALKPNTEYVFEYDVTTDVKAQAFMFFYNSSGSNSEAPSNMSIKTNNGAWASKTESNSWFGNYNNAGTYHFAIKFTTGATTTQASFRFGNTSNDPVTSTFSNIRLIDSARYYEDAVYETFEDVYEEYAYYGTLQTPVRNGYTFKGWFDAEGNEVTAIDNATEHKSIFSEWTINDYTITYNANGGSVSPTSELYNVEDTLNIPTPTRAGYVFQGWLVTVSDGNWELNGICSPGEVPAKMYGNVTLTAQWALSELKVYFDTILDFSKWNTTSAGNATISNVTDNGFTLTSYAGAGEGTSESPEFPVTAGKQYYIDIDFTGDNWDVYIFFRNETTGGTGIDFNDSTNRFSSSGAGVQSRTFTAPAGATKAVIRVDANGSSNSVTFSDIRVYEATTCAPNVNVPESSKEVQYGSTFGALPVPTREGYTFAGWYDGNTLITDSTTVTQTSTVYLKSKWTENSYTIIYNSNGGSGTIENQTVKYSQNVTLASGGFTKTGSTLLGWSTNSAATTAQYSLGQSVSQLSATANGTVTLYAIWSENTYTIVYNANGGSGTIENQTVKYSQNVTLASSGITRSGYNLLGWSTNSAATTAQYSLGQSVSKLSATANGTVTLYAVWVITDDALVSDTVVVDFASPIAITPLANDTIFNSASGTRTFLGITADGTSTPASSLTGTYGEFTVSDGTVTYKPTKVVNGTEKIYYHASVLVNGVTTNIKNEIIVAPASNVLYEENIFTSTETSSLDWTKGTASTVNQDASPERNEVYGYDTNKNGYNKIANYSNGSALTVTVDETNKRSENISFNFMGEGFDLIGACGSNTGVLVVSLKNNEYVEDGKVVSKVVKSYIVDTYYSDLDENIANRYADTLYQVPLISENGLDYSNYTVQIVASYLPSMSGALSTQAVGDADNELLREALAEVGLEYALDAESVEIVWFDEDSILNGGEGVNTVEDGMLETQAVTSLLNVVDSVRVYKPIEDGDAYYIPSERNAKYYNVIDNLVNVKDGNIISGTDADIFAYISGKDKESIAIENYAKIGPKDELYLTSGTGAVAFSIKDFDKSTSRVMISLRAASGTPTVKIGEYEFDVISNTEMYYDITDYIKEGIVTIENQDSGTLLSIGSVKVTSQLNETVLLSSDFDLVTASFMMMAPAKAVEPNTPIVPEDTTDPSEPDDTTDPDDSDEPANPDDSAECWLVRLINWIIAKFKKILSALNSIIGF